MNWRALQVTPNLRESSNARRRPSAMVSAWLANQMVGRKGNVSQIPSNSLSTRTTTTSPSIKLKAFAYCSSKDTQFSPERSPVHRIWAILFTHHIQMDHDEYVFILLKRQEVHETSNIVLVGSEQDSAILDPELRHAGLPSVGKS